MSDSPGRNTKQATEKYESSFSKTSSTALQYALDIRKFEIELYCKRAGYFWTLIGVSFAGFFVVLGSRISSDAKQLPCFVIACAGFIFSVAWYLASRGSKFWQENWEAHVDLLEDKSIGPLYKTVIHPCPPSQRSGFFGLIEYLFGLFSFVTFGPFNYSVSKINIIICLYVAFIWFGLIFYSAFQIGYDEALKLDAQYTLLSFLFVSYIFLVILFLFGRSSEKPILEVYGKVRDTQIQGLRGPAARDL